MYGYKLCFDPLIRMILFYFHITNKNAASYLFYYIAKDQVVIIQTNREKVNNRTVLLTLTNLYGCYIQKQVIIHSNQNYQDTVTLCMCVCVYIWACI